MLRRLYTTGLLLAVVGCGFAKTPHSESSSLPLREPSSPAGPNRVCYVGAGESPDCYATLMAQQIEAPRGRPNWYKYADPFRDPSFPRGMNPEQYLPPDRFVDTREISPSAWLSRSFTRAELMPAGETRGHYALFSRVALERIQALRDKVGRPVEITSAYRSPGYNAELDRAAKWSRHTYGDAIDFQISGLNYQQAAKLCLEVGAAFYQIYDDHIHCDWRNQTLDGGYFTPISSPSQLEDISSALGRSARIIQRLQNLESVRTLSLEAKIWQEDPGVLSHEWIVTLPSGEMIHGSRPILALNLQEISDSGPINVKVIVGGSITIESTINLPE